MFITQETCAFSGNGLLTHECNIAGHHNVVGLVNHGLCGVGGEQVRNIKLGGDRGMDRTLTKVKREMAQMSLVCYIVALCEECVETAPLYTRIAHQDLRAGSQSFRHK